MTTETANLVLKSPCDTCTTTGVIGVSNDANIRRKQGLIYSVFCGICGLCGFSVVVTTVLTDADIGSARGTTNLDTSCCKDEEEKGY